MCVEKHPHACGEDLRRITKSGTHLETPPRMWGRPLVNAAHPINIGNTPTHVGKTHRRSVKQWYTRKHPHACGEDPPVISQPTDFLETPPRMWGRPVLQEVILQRLGNTPTHVGKTRFYQLCRISSGKHPHACGEDYQPKPKPIAPKETPPRMWGRLSASCRKSFKGRNTPTHVGKTCRIVWA